MKRIVFSLALAVLVFSVNGCQLASLIAHGSLPSSVTVKKVSNISGAKALAVMPAGIDSKTGAVMTKSGITDKDGNTVLATFEFSDAGNGNSSLWKKIMENLSLVPDIVKRLSSNYLLLYNVSEQIGFDWRDDSIGRDEDNGISSLLNSLRGHYLLRLNDGALFRLPDDLRADYGAPSSLGADRYIQSSSDNKTLVICGNDESVKAGGLSTDFGIMVISDIGNTIEVKTLANELFSPLTVCGFLLDKNNRIIIISSHSSGEWSFDLDLNPLYLDYGDKLKKLSQSDLRFFPFTLDRELYCLQMDRDRVMSLYKITQSLNSMDAEYINSIFIENPPTALMHFVDPWSVIDRPLETGRLLIHNEGIIIANIRSGELNAIPFPNGFPRTPTAYDENGIAYELKDLATIDKYDIGTMKHSSVKVKWDMVPVGQLISSSRSEFVGGIFSVTGITRQAQTVSVLIDAETGDVTLADLEDYEGTVVKTYVRLN